MIPVIHNCIVWGSRVKEEVCERCGRTFAYELHRTAEGVSVNLLLLEGNKGAKTAAKTEAVESLQYRLEHESDVVCCPSCGHLQRRMIRLLRNYTAQFTIALFGVFSLPSVILLVFWFEHFALFKNQLMIAFLLLIGSALVASVGAILFWRNPDLICRLLVGGRKDPRL
jgi:hypothetical protein